MTKYASSIIIPAYNEWQLTRRCLKTLAATTREQNIEVIVIDNASADETPKGAPFLGKTLFNDAFTYVRNDINRNYAGANNQGAEIARGEYLVLLNNDTELLPGWHEKLLADFSQFPDIAATGPLLLYPASEPFGHCVQHLGVFIDPLLKVGHLYAGIPADSPLAQKRRFFQIITAACMMIPKKLYLEAGKLDENFINGFEDVDLCARLCSLGRCFTVNPDAHVIHHTSSSQGRFDHDEANGIYLFQQEHFHRLRADLCSHLDRDGIDSRLSPWLELNTPPKPEVLSVLDKKTEALSFEELKKSLVSHPYWENGWKRFLNMDENAHCRETLQKTAFRFFNSPWLAAEFCEQALHAKNLAAAVFWLNMVADFVEQEQGYQEKSSILRDVFHARGLKDLEEQVKNWQANAEKINNCEFKPFNRKYFELRREIIPLLPKRQSRLA